MTEQAEEGPVSEEAMDQVEGEAEAGPVVRLRDEESAGRKG